MALDKIKADVIVSLQYRLTLDNGNLVEETTDDDPLMYLHGHDNIIPGLERELEGLSVGDSKTVIVEAENAYGEIDPDGFDVIPRSDLPKEIKPEEGLVLTVEDEDGHIFDVRISEVEQETVVIDFNHPLAGKRLHFDVTITDLRDPTAEELDHGHVHEDHDHPH